MYGINRYVLAMVLKSDVSSTCIMTNPCGVELLAPCKCANAVITEFPYRSMLSVLVAPFCVYPTLGRYFKVSIHRVYTLGLQLFVGTNFSGFCK